MSKRSLAELLIESSRKAQEERDFNAHVARVAAIAKPDIEKILAQHKAETSQSLACPSCGAPLPEGWRADDVTSESDDNQDEDNEQDDDDDDDDDRELDAKAKSRIVAELLARKRRSASS
jgi:hypothetical protein